MNNIYEVKILKKSVKRIIAAALFAASILTFAACQGGGNNPAGTTGGSKQTNTTDPADTEFIQDEIPAGTDLGGVTVTMFWWQDGTDGEFVNEGDGDGVDEAKYTPRRCCRGKTKGKAPPHRQKLYMGYAGRLS